MGNVDYNSPAQYEGGYTPRPNPLPRILSIIAFIAVLAVAGWWGWQYFQMKQFQRQLEDKIADVPPPAVLVGDQYVWRILEQAVRPNSATYNPGGLVTGDFDADGDDEVLKIAADGQSIIYQPDGSTAPAGISGMEFSMECASWDYDRDGIAEIIVKTSIAKIAQERGESSASFQGVDLESSLPVFDLAGRVVATFDVRGVLYKAPLTGDVDGDGWAELLLPDPGGATGNSLRWTAFGAGGARAATISQQSGVKHADDWGVLLGDVTGDGADDLVYLITKLRSLRYVNVDKATGELGTVPSGIVFKACRDVNGDGLAEVLAGTGFLDPATGQFTAFYFPAGTNIGYTSPLRKCVTGDFDGDGAVEVVTSEALGSDISVFAADGHCIHCEQTGKRVFDAEVIHSGSQDYLVVQLHDRLLIYP